MRGWESVGAQVGYQGDQGALPTFKGSTGENGWEDGGGGGGGAAAGGNNDAGWGEAPTAGERGSKALCMATCKVTCMTHRHEAPPRGTPWWAVR